MSDPAVRQPCPGDIWHLTHDGAYLGTGLIVASFDRHWCLVWPLTERSAPHGESTILIEGADESHAVAWPTLETGVNQELLTQYVASPFDAAGAHALAHGVESGGVDLPAGAHRAVGEDLRGERLSALVGRWTRICFLEPTRPSPQPPC